MSPDVDVKTDRSLWALSPFITESPSDSWDCFCSLWCCWGGGFWASCSLFVCSLCRPQQHSHVAAAALPAPPPPRLLGGQAFPTDSEHVYTTGPLASGGEHENILSRKMCRENFVVVVAAVPHQQQQDVQPSAFLCVHVPTPTLAAHSAYRCQKAVPVRDNGKQWSRASQSVCHRHI